MLIHGAHGYLINRFLSPYTNRRTDQYGGTPANRARFALEIIQGIRKACGKGDPIVIRLSACEYLDYIGLPPEEGITLELAKQYCENLYSQPLHAVWPVFSRHTASVFLVWQEKIPVHPASLIMNTGS